MSQAVKEALASLRDSLARLSQRSFDDFALFQSVTAALFRCNEAAKRLAVAMAAGPTPAGDAPVALQLLTAGGKVAVAEPAVAASITTAVKAAGAALQATETWLTGPELESASASKPKTARKSRAPGPRSTPPALAPSSAGKDRAPKRKPGPRSRPGR